MTACAGWGRLLRIDRPCTPQRKTQDTREEVAIQAKTHATVSHARAGRASPEHQFGKPEKWVMTCLSLRVRRLPAGYISTPSGAAFQLTNAVGQVWGWNGTTFAARFGAAWRAAGTERLPARRVPKPRAG